MKKNKEKWKVFYLKDTKKELCAYTLYGSFKGEEKSTIESLCYEYNVNKNDIIVKIKER